MRKKILLIEDEEGLVLTLSHRLQSEGYEVACAADGDVGLERGRSESFDLILLDLMLPGRSGFDVCRELRQAQIATPLMMLTARDQILDKVVGFKLGADDYLIKPFEMAELLARLEALLRRSQPNPPLLRGEARFGDVEVNWDSGETRRAGHPVSLSAREFRLLQYLMHNRNRIVSRQQLLHDVWGYAAQTSTRTVDVHIAWLRQKLEPAPRYPRYILTVHGQGYKFIG